MQDVLLTTYVEVLDITGKMSKNLLFFALLNELLMNVDVVLQIRFCRLFDIKPAESSLLKTVSLAIHDFLNSPSVNVLDLD